MSSDEITLSELPGWGKLSGANLFISINSRRDISLGRFIFLWESVILEKTQRIYAEYFKSLENFFEAIALVDPRDELLNFEIYNIDGIGHKSVNSIINFFHSEDYRGYHLKDLLKKSRCLTFKEKIRSLVSYHIKYLYLLVI